MIDALKILSAYQCCAKMKPAIAHIPPSGVSAPLAPVDQFPVSFNKQQPFYIMLGFIFSGKKVSRNKHGSEADLLLNTALHILKRSSGKRKLGWIL